MHCRRYGKDFHIKKTTKLFPDHILQAWGHVPRTDNTAQDEHWADTAWVMKCNAIILVSWWQYYLMLHRCLRKSQLSMVLLGKYNSEKGKHRNWAKIGRGINLKSKFCELEMNPNILGEMSFRADWAARVNCWSFSRLRWKVNLLNLTDQVWTLSNTTHTINQE